jgi:hypothetical protein
MKGLPRSLAHAKAGTEQSPRRVRYDLKNFPITVTAGSTTAKGLGTAVMGALPEGNILYLGGVAYLQFFTADADAIATWAGDYSVSTAPAADTDLSGADGNLIGTSEIAAATAKLSPVSRGVSLADCSEIYDNTASALELNLNLTTDDDSVTDAATAIFTVTGYVELVFIVLGDD